MKNIKKATIEMFNWFIEEHELTKEEAIEDSDFLEEFNEVFVEHFETLLHEKNISKSTLQEAEKLDSKEEIISYLKSIL
jgi:hypothetical protein